LLVSSVSVGSFGAVAQPASTRAQTAEKAEEVKSRMGDILWTACRWAVASISPFSGSTRKTELLIVDAHYYRPR
jgi:hypothetical protein